MRIKDMHPPPLRLRPDIYQDTAILPSQRTGSMLKVPSTSVTDSGTCYQTFLLFVHKILERCNMVLPAGQRL